MSEACQSSIVVNCGAVIDDRIGVPPTVGMLVLSISVNHPFTIRVPVAPRFVKNPVAHRMREEPRSSVLSVSETREVLIATEERLSRAVVAHPLAGVSRAREPSACTVRTSPSTHPEKFISSALAVIVPEAISQGWSAESAKAPCAVVATARSPEPRRVVEFTVLIFVPDTRVACFSLSSSLIAACTSVAEIHPAGVLVICHAL